jgi:hypothetical protein
MMMVRKETTSERRELRNKEIEDKKDHVHGPKLSICKVSSLLGVSP